MTVIFVPYLPEHYRALEVQSGQAWFAEQVSAGYADHLAECAFAQTGFDEEGNILGCAGIVDGGGPDGCRAIVWAILSHNIRPRHFIAIDRRVRAQIKLALQRWDRIEAFVDPTFSNSVYWVQQLGFTARAQLPCYWPGRRTALIVDMIAPERAPAGRTVLSLDDTGISGGNAAEQPSCSEGLDQ